MDNITLKIQRKPYAIARTGWSKSTLHNRINEELFPPPISLGARAVGFLEHEIDQVIAAMVAGNSKSHIQKLVRSLISSRQLKGYRS